MSYFPRAVTHEMKRSLCRRGVAPRAFRGAGGIREIIPLTLQSWLSETWLPFSRDCVEWVGVQKARRPENPATSKTAFFFFGALEKLGRPLTRGEPVIALRRAALKPPAEAGIEERSEITKSTSGGHGQRHADASNNGICARHCSLTVNKTTLLLFS
jgi:hypothetical protein